MKEDLQLRADLRFRAKTGWRGHFAVAAILAAAIATTTGSTAEAQIDGSCLGYFSADNPDMVGDLSADGRIERSDRVPLLVARAPMLEEPRAGAPQSSAPELTFGERVWVLRQQGDYLEVSRVVGDDRCEFMEDPDPERCGPTGWVHADDLLCRTRPLEAQGGVSQKFFVRTAANFTGEEAAVIQPTNGPRSEECSRLNEDCVNLTRFTLFYIFAEDPETGRVLLLGRQTTEGETPLIGWVDADAGFRWNSRYGMRPTANLTFDPETGRFAQGEEVVVCLYRTLEEASAAVDGLCDAPILGGARWFSSTIRIPVLDRVVHDGEPYLQVALPIAGVGEDAMEDVMRQVAGLDGAISALQSLNNIDVFFLIDGTQSMEPHIDALVGRGDTRFGIIPAIQNAFATDPRFENVDVRYGYRVYRDVYTGENFGIGDGIDLDSNCSPSDADLAANRAAVENGIRSIDTQLASDRSGGDDHEENLALGLAFAIDDMQACPDNVKLLFVIGDTGFDSERLQEDGVPIFAEEQILGLVSESIELGTSPIVPFFIQVPRARETEEYSEAYELFTRQARSMVGAIQRFYTIGLEQRADFRIEENFFSLEGRSVADAQPELVAYILDRVQNYGDQSPVNQIIAELRTGEGLVQIIEALRGASDGVPALRLAQIERRVCEELGEGCTQRVVSDVAEGYIAHTDDIVMDVLLNGEEFRAWRERLQIVRNLNAMSAVEMSRLIVNMMLEGTGRTAGELSPGELEMSAAEYLKLRFALPVSDQTPLLSYSLRDFVCSAEGENFGFCGNEVDYCELLYVARWLSTHNLVFDAIDRSEIPRIELSDVTGCAIRGAVRDLNFIGAARFPDPDTMSFDFVRMNARDFWVPEEFLP
jgi:hypothetical protein